MARLSWPWWLVTYLWTVIHLSTNLAQRGVTSLRRPTMLPLDQAANAHTAIDIIRKAVTKRQPDAVLKRQQITAALLVLTAETWVKQNTKQLWQTNGNTRPIHLEQTACIKYRWIISIQTQRTSELHSVWWWYCSYCCWSSAPVWYYSNKNHCRHQSIQWSLRGASRVMPQYQNQSNLQRTLKAKRCLKACFYTISRNLRSCAGLGPCLALQRTRSVKSALLRFKCLSVY